MIKKLKNFIKNKKGSYVQMILLLPVLLFLLVLIGVELDYVSVRNVVEEDAKTALRYVVREKNGDAAKEKLVGILKALGEERGIDYSNENNFKAFIYNVTENYDGEYLFNTVSEEDVIPFAQWGDYKTVGEKQMYYWRRGNFIELNLYNITSGIYNSSAEVCFMGSDNCINFLSKPAEVTIRMAIEYEEKAYV